MDAVGPYKIERELGRGGQGAVYLAEDTRLRRKVALKVLSGLGSQHEDTLRRFQREAEVASKLEHVQQGFFYLHAGMAQDGLTAFDAARRLNADNVEAIGGEAIALAHLDRNDDARRLLTDRLRVSRAPEGPRLAPTSHGKGVRGTGRLVLGDTGGPFPRGLPRPQ